MDSSSSSMKSHVMSISDEESVKKKGESSKPTVKYFNITSKQDIQFSETFSTTFTNDSFSSNESNPYEHTIDLSSFTSFYTVCIDGFNRIFTVDIYNHDTQKSAAFFIGILHGASGPGVFLGLLPAIKLSEFSASLIYLLVFTISSTLSMGLFSLAYTSITKCISKKVGTDRVELFISIFSAFLLLLFGFFWLTTTILFPYSPFNFNNHV